MHYFKREDAKRRRNQEINTIFWGWITLGFACLFVVTFLYTAFVSKWMPSVGNIAMDWISQDEYYSYLWVIIVFPVSVVFVYMNWLSLKVFRHN